MFGIDYCSAYSVYSNDLKYFLEDKYYFWAEIFYTYRLFYLGKFLVERQLDTFEEYFVL